MTLLKVYNKNGYCRQSETPAMGYSGLLDEFTLRDLISNESRYVSPRVNIREDAGAFEIEMESPGIDKNLLKMNISKDILSISYKSEETGKNEKFTYREFNNESFERSFRLSDSVDKEKISASYKDGILLVKLPKKEESIDKGPRSIEIS